MGPVPLPAVLHGCYRSSRAQTAVLAGMLMLHRVQAVMVGVGVGAAFLPRRYGGVGAGWKQQAGLEWLHRLASEPRRLWRRYLLTNTLFVLGAAAQLLRRRFSGPAGEARR